MHSWPADAVAPLAWLISCRLHVLRVTFLGVVAADRGFHAYRPWMLIIALPSFQPCAACVLRAPIWDATFLVDTGEQMHDDSRWY